MKGASQGRCTRCERLGVFKLREVEPRSWQPLCPRCETAYSLEAELHKLRAEAAYIRGHLEGYAARLENPAVLWRVDQLAHALREDAKRLEKLEGSE